jgi:hypothetical protein
VTIGNLGRFGENETSTMDIDVKAQAFSLATQNSRSPIEGEDGAPGFDEVVHPAGESGGPHPRD